MRNYQTAQKQILLEYLELHHDRAFSIDELATCMIEDPSLSMAPGKSTIYRIMPKLIQEGRVKRFVKKNSRQFLYQMVSGEHCERHFHLKCYMCGKILHMEEKQSSKIIDEAFQKQRFMIDQQTSILFGCCESCH